MKIIISVPELLPITQLEKSQKYQVTVKHDINHSCSVSSSVIVTNLDYGIVTTARTLFIARYRLTTWKP